jgi:hypothetical protein
MYVSFELFTAVVRTDYQYLIVHLLQIEVNLTKISLRILFISNSAVH